MLGRHVKKAAIIAACATGCKNPPPTFELSEEQLELIHQKIDEVQLSDNLHKALAGFVPDSHLFNAEAEYGLSEYTVNVDDSVNVLLDLERNGRIFAYHGNGPESSEEYQDASAFFQSDETGPYIAINLDTNTPLENFGASGLLHEAAHNDSPTHSIKVSSYTDPHGDYLTAEFVDLVIEKGDYPYLTSFFGIISDRVIFDMKFEREILDSFGQQLKSGEISPERAHELAMDQTIAKEKSIWAAKLTEILLEYVDYLNTLGVSQDELRLALEQETDIYTEFHEAYLERLAEIEQEFQPESRREFRPTPRR